MKQKFTFGPLQTAWLKSLREHPERQMRDLLGQRCSDGSYKACCLGEAGLIANVCMFNERGELRTKNGLISDCYLDDVYTSIGLRSRDGQRKDDGNKELSHLNDTGYTWPQIADIIEAEPEQYFTESK